MAAIDSYYGRADDLKTAYEEMFTIHKIKDTLAMLNDAPHTPAPSSPYVRNRARPPDSMFSTRKDDGFGTPTSPSTLKSTDMEDGEILNPIQETREPKPHEYQAQAPQSLERRRADVYRPPGRSPPRQHKSRERRLKRSNPSTDVNAIRLGKRTRMW